VCVLHCAYEVAYFSGIYLASERVSEMPDIVPNINADDLEVIALIRHRNFKFVYTNLCLYGKKMKLVLCRLKSWDICGYVTR
jgi:hypothetical protein